MVLAHGMGVKTMSAVRLPLSASLTESVGRDALATT
jgi:hypothetical protein